MTPLEKITKARAALITSQPFWGALALRLRLEACPAIKTADVDGVTMRFNPEFVAALTLPELTGVVAHETAHCALGHCWRVGDRDADRWNKAADYAVNPMLESAGFTLPKGALSDPKFAGMSADAIYQALPPDPKPQQDKAGGGKQQQQSGGGTGGQQKPQPGNSGQQQAAGNDPGGCGGVRQPAAPDGSLPSPADLSQLAQDWKVAATQAAAVAKAAGMMPGDLARAVDEAKAPRVDWRDVLARFVATAAPSDYRWSPANRRYMAAGLYLPSIRPEHLAHVALFVDVSGSVTADELAMYAGEFNAVLEYAKPDRVTVTYCNTKVTGRDEYTAGDYPVRLAAKGGGGTDFRPPFADLEARGEFPDCAIYLTDLEAPAERFPDDPGYPVLWVTTGRTVAPFGEVIELKE